MDMRLEWSLLGSVPSERFLAGMRPWACPRGRWGGGAGSPASLGRSSGNWVPRGPSLMPALAWQLNEVYRQIAGSHKLQQTKFRCVLPWVRGVGAGAAPGPPGSRPLLFPQAAAQRREKVS